nr:uncharacterized protein LOC113827143 [Penaeus vannamei]
MHQPQTPAIQRTRNTANTIEQNLRAYLHPNKGPYILPQVKGTLSAARPPTAARTSRQPPGPPDSRQDLPTAPPDSRQDLPTSPGPPTAARTSRQPPGTSISRREPEGRGTDGASPGRKDYEPQCTSPTMYSPKDKTQPQSRYNVFKARFPTCLDPITERIKFSSPAAATPPLYLRRSRHIKDYRKCDV